MENCLLLRENLRYRIPDGVKITKNKDTVYVERDGELYTLRECLRYDRRKQPYLKKMKPGQKNLALRADTSYTPAYRTRKTREKSVCK